MSEEATDHNAIARDRNIKAIFEKRKHDAGYMLSQAFINSDVELPTPEAFDVITDVMAKWMEAALYKTFEAEFQKDILRQCAGALEPIIKRTNSDDIEISSEEELFMKLPDIISDISELIGLLAFEDYDVDGTNPLKVRALDKRLKTLSYMKDIASSKGNYDFDPYLHGMANGLILAKAVMEGTDPQYLDKPAEGWSSDKPPEVVKMTICEEHIRQRRV